MELLSQACSQRPYPSHVVEDQGYGAGPTEVHSRDAYSGTLEDAVLHNTNQFHKWHAELETAYASEMEEKYKRYADLLNSHRQSCEDILSKVDSTLACFDTLSAQHKDVSQKSKALYNSCEQLVKEKDQLAEFADAIRVKLKFFDEFETVYSQFQRAQLSLDNDQFLQLLKKLDDCIAYVATNPQYADAGAYTTKFRQLQGRALGAVRNKVQQVFRHATQQVQAAVQEAAPKTEAPATPGRRAQPQQMPLLEEGAEVYLLYVRFRAAAEPNLKGLLKEIESRGQRSEYQRLLVECQNLYAQARLQLVSPLLSQRLAIDQANMLLPAFTRTGCEHLLRACQLEAQLFEQFFPSASNVPDRLSALSEPLCTVLYDALRPAIIMLQDIDELCEMVDILKHEVLGDQLAKRGSGGESLRPMLTRTLADVQERLIYRCQAFIKEYVVAYMPSPQDIDYPAKLSQPNRASGSAAGAEGAGGTAGSLVEESRALLSNGDDGAGGAPEREEEDVYSTLYPPLRATLLCLSKLYRAVDGPIFSGLAQEAVSACTVSVQQASTMLARKVGALDAQLFMIKHLLFLREHIAPFNVQFAVTDFDLDFSHMRDHMRNILGGQGSLFSMGNNAVMKMLGTGGPRVLTYQVDSKKELEKRLKAVCESFIMAATKVAVDPMLSFLTKVTAVRVAAQANPAAARPLRDQAFASPAKVAEMVSKVNEALAGPLPATINKLRAYLPNPQTYFILYKPIKSSVAEAHGQMQALIVADYTPEEAASIPLKQQEELSAILDALCHA